MSCKKSITVKSLEEVSTECKKGYHCKSKYNHKDKTFTVDVQLKNDTCPITSKEDPHKVYLKSITPETVKQDLTTFLQEIPLQEIIETKCKNKAKDQCKIVAKVNYTSASQKNYHYYTDPTFVNTITDYIKNTLGYKNINLVESENMFAIAFPSATPDKYAKVIGYKENAINLSQDYHIPVKYKNGSANISETMLEADVIIDLPKAKNHDLMKMTGALKNMYGSIPDPNKFLQFHKEKSGLYVTDATLLVNHSTPVDFTIVDFIDSVDGNEVSLYEHPSEYKHFKSNLLLAGKDQLSIDKVIAHKMGYGENESPILKTESDFVGDFPITQENLEGGTLDPLPNWKKVDCLFGFGVKLQHYLPLSEKFMASVIKNRYHFDKDLILEPSELAKEKEKEKEKK